MEPLVSILIPAFNAEDWIADCLRSALAQDWPRKEIIVLDDGSTDGTQMVAQEFASDGVLVLAQPNQGAAATRNRLFEQCQGDYIQWLDADDLLSPGKIANQMRRVVRGSGSRTVFTCEWSRFMHRPDRAISSPTPLWSDLAPAEWMRLKMGHNLYMANATWLVSRALAEATGPWDSSLCYDDDGEYFARLLLHCDAVEFVPGSRVLCRTSAFGTVSDIGRSDRKMESLMRSMRLQVRYLRSLDDSERARAACLDYLQVAYAGFYPERPDLIDEARGLASELGGTLVAPRLSWKYAWIEWCLGASAAKMAQMTLRRARATAMRTLDNWSHQVGRFAK